MRNRLTHKEPVYEKSISPLKVSATSFSRHPQATDLLESAAAEIQSYLRASPTPVFRTEFDERHDDWRLDGLTVNIEFSRVSSSRLGALTLVIDPSHGTPTQVAWCLSTTDNVEDSVADLSCRERCSVLGIAQLRVTPDDNGPSAGPGATIMPWARARQLDAVIWTALPSNFEDEVNRHFTIAEAVTYIQRLSVPAKVKAAEYVWRAPEFVRTPLRAALQREPWFARTEGA